ncbi:macrolide 2'-phosphotransferase [Alteribacter lacisalsi]|uniref:Macrolide 2'-phosphotransferase n=1 Tax=Alteribacter lacisalsi TaxID=2045244 RepID=A0A2W0HE48_9BACI|nr:macrolide 2'-phosphotransferase [Alteribacter lacisalsi]PYZ99141.1 macrolide 2'-phosphotransferase [Alteribacter lacisalsi]
MVMTIKEILKTAAANGLAIKEESVKLNESGLDFQVAHAEDESGVKWILRLPRRSDAMKKTVLEKQVLDVVNRHVGFEAPQWEVYTNDLIAYRQLSGVPAGTIDPAIQNYRWEFDYENVPPAYFSSLGKVLADLHRVPAEKVKEISGLKVQTITEAKADLAERMNAVKADIGVGEDLWNRWQAWLANDDLWPEHTALVHGEVHAGHTLIDGHARVTGLIDWTEAAITDVSRDFMAPLMIFGEAGLDQVIKGYEKAGGRTWPRMRRHVIELLSTYGLDVYEFAKASDSEEYMEIARQSLGVSE